MANFWYCLRPAIGWVLGTSEPFECHYVCFLREGSESACIENTAKIGFDTSDTETLPVDLLVILQ